MKNIKKITAMFLAVLTIFGSACVPCAYADNLKCTPTDYEESTVASISVVSRITNITGHVWLYIENKSAQELKLGHYFLPAGEGVSVSLLSFSCSDGWGIYYNVESYCNNTFSNRGAYSLTEDLDAKEFEKISSYIEGYSNHWDPVFNCMFFAFTAWNKVSSKKLIPLVLPIFGQIQMMLYGAESNSLDMYYPSADRVYRQRGFGSLGHLEQVSSKSIDSDIG